MYTEEDKAPIGFLCGLFGKTKQAYYQRKEYTYKEVIKGDIVYQKVIKYRKLMPRAGGRKLYYLLKNDLPEEIQMGRDKFFDWLRSNELLVKKRKVRIYTTNSHHWLRKYPYLLTDHVSTAPNQLWVSDITYITTEEGVMYLFLITDAYSKKIIGWKLSDNLRAENALAALKMALKQWNGRSHQLIHHSDRGVQYCSEKYVDLLKRNGIAISMTQSGNPLDNSIAERVNGILKDEWLYQTNLKTKRSAVIYLGKIINTYNNVRPHLSLGMQTPQIVHQQSGQVETLKKLWKNYYRKNPEQSGAEAP